MAPNQLIASGGIAPAQPLDEQFVAFGNPNRGGIGNKGYGHRFNPCRYIPNAAIAGLFSIFRTRCPCHELGVSFADNRHKINIYNDL